MFQPLFSLVLSDLTVQKEGSLSQQRQTLAELLLPRVEPSFLMGSPLSRNVPKPMAPSSAPPPRLLLASYEPLQARRTVSQLPIASCTVCLFPGILCGFACVYTTLPFKKRRSRESTCLLKETILFFMIEVFSGMASYMARS